MQITWQQRLTLYQNDTGPVLQPLITDVDEVTIINLTGYAAWISFWVPGFTPHVVRAALVTGASGLITYTPLGDEFATLGELRYQATAMHPDYTENAATGAARGYYRFSGPVCSALVVRKPS